ncbi:hypothetical protein SAMN05421748_12222 [Paractinoplanes atraurantiacus]|uniref:ABC-2 type transport system ATP-binding protein n=1 Tax=Paractinoplanes atraurantiacus TaxID=1036182 RepID=A0A285JKU6_9ACTN|nr:hypothetical protein SAMN05421748_12222 [Actinoplanes atraurantiacus]
MVRILATLLAADAGTARINGFDVAARAAGVRASISPTGQFAAVDEILTGRENRHAPPPRHRDEPDREPAGRVPRRAGDRARPGGRIEVWHAVRTLAEGGTTVLLTTQYLDEAEQLADRIAILHEGRIIVDGTLAELTDLQSGIFERFQSMPIARSGVLWAHVPTSLLATMTSVVLAVETDPRVTRLLALMRERGWARWTRLERLSQP